MKFTSNRLSSLALESYDMTCIIPERAPKYVLCSLRPALLITGKKLSTHNMQMRNMARRFITLVDELYNASCRLVCTAAGRPEELFATSVKGDTALFNAEQLEQLQFESAAEGMTFDPPISCAHFQSSFLCCSELSYE